MATKIFIIGGTGAQGIPIIRSLVSDSKYHCVVLTRDTSSQRAQSLLALGSVSFISGTFADETVLRSGFSSCTGCFVNLDGFNTGEKAEIYWAIRCYELALECGIQFFVYGNLDYGYKKSGYEGKFRAGHYDGKGRIGEWILFQERENRKNATGKKMGVSVFTTGPYMDMAISSGTIMTPTIESGVVTWRCPLGPTGAVNYVSLEDCGFYVRWLFDHPSLANGLDLEVAIAPITGAEWAAAFEKVTGHKAQFIDTPMEEWWERMGPWKDMPAGYNADPNDKSTMTVKDNFSGFWNMWRERVLKRDYRLMDEIHPGRVKSAEEWFRKQDEIGKKEGKGGLWERVQKENLKPILKIAEDGRKGKL